LQRGRIEQPFVEWRSNRLGVGKLVGRAGDLATVEYFRSPADSEAIREQVPFASLTQKTLCPQTRVYYRDAVSFSWSVGRVMDYQADDACYLIRFPNDDSRLIPSDQLLVRCSFPIAEPTDHLANQLNETAFWHSARSEFVRHLVEQQRVSRGLSALLSSSVEIVAHQASAIQRVLLDPFQRYLLADEVGLGKTIEAGVLIKQFAIDEPYDHTTLVIVPETLMIQWQQELTHRFHLGHLLDESIHLVSSRNQAAIKQHAATSKMIVVDEAHHLSSWAWSTIDSERETFEFVSRATNDLGRRVLLLSATPVLHNEKSFLAMLHLLDPQVYPLDSLDSFKERVRLRQEIAECMLSLTETESNLFLTDTVEELGGLLTQDAEFQSLRSELATLLEDDVAEDDTTRNALIRAIRTHVSDMWRLHRRILRSRRNEQTSVYLPGRGGAKRILYDCENEHGLAEAVEAWRLCISAACFSSSESEKGTANSLARTVEEFAATEPSLLVDWANDRLRGGFDIGTHSFPIRDGELDLLKQIVRAAKECDHGTKLQKLLALVGTSEDASSYVVFTDAKSTADHVFEFLDLRLTKGRTLRHSTTNQQWRQFRSSQHGYVLVCDRSAEEGLNLQKRGTVAIHFDLPFSPNRIEQRMGRLDRFGQGMPVQTAVLVSESSPIQKRWFELLDSALGVFHRSIATLQYVIEDSLQLVWNEFLDSGADAFAEAIERLGGEEGTVANELKRIRAQDDIDSYDTDQLTQSMADELENSDRQLSRTSPQIFSNWAVESLRFRRSGEESRVDEVFAYQFYRRIDSGHRPRGQDTLMPQDEFESRFRRSIDNLPCELPTRYVSVPLTFDRVVAQERSTRLLRVGDPFVDAFEQYARWDDRGVCFAFWRHCPAYKPTEDPDVFFRFDYVLSPNPKPLLELCNRTAGANVNSLLRRSRAIMEPRFTTVWLDSNLDRVMPNDERFGPLLKTPFGKSALPWGRDYNLNSDRWNSAAKLYDMSLWRDLCFAARRKSESILREHSKLPELTADCVRRAKELAQRVDQQYQSRLRMATGQTTDYLQNELNFETSFLSAQIESFLEPELRADSVGAVFLSCRSPFAEQNQGRGRRDDD